MKTSKRIDREIHAVVDTINSQLIAKSLRTPEAEAAFAIYYTLLWARGRHDGKQPLIAVEKLLGVAKEKSAR
jgi:hypothetical protein